MGTLRLVMGTLRLVMGTQTLVDGLGLLSNKTNHDKDTSSCD